MEDVYCIACSANCTENGIDFVMTEDGPLCVLCLDEAREEDPHEKEGEEYDY